MRVVFFSVTALLAGCIVQAPAPQGPQPAAVYPPAQPYAPEQAYAPEPPAAAVSIYDEPPTSQPPPIAVGWAPPPMLVEVPPPEPFAGAIWVGGYWVWQGNWVWAHGHWMGPPQPQYVWVHPYYEHRADEVIFIDGHWSPPGVAFVPPPPGVLVVETPAVGVIAGPRPLGPEGCFVPAPPGSRAGIIIPAPVGTAPAVVTSAPPVVAVGMRITNTTNVTNVTNVTNITRVTNVTIVAPAGATADGRSFNGTVPAAPHLAAARPALVQARAPQPLSARPLPSYVPGGRPPALPHPPLNAAGATPHPQEAFGREPPPVHATPTAFEARAAGSNGAASHLQTQPPPHPQANQAHDDGQSRHAGGAAPHTPPANNKPQTKPQEKAAAPHPQTQEGRDEGKHERQAPAEH